METPTALEEPLMVFCKVASSGRQRRGGRRGAGARRDARGRVGRSRRVDGGVGRAERGSWHTRAAACADLAVLGSPEPWRGRDRLGKEPSVGLNRGVPGGSERARVSMDAAAGGPGQGFTIRSARLLKGAVG